MIARDMATGDSRSEAEVESEECTGGGGCALAECGAEEKNAECAPRPVTPAALGCNSESLLGPGIVPLTELPDLVVDEILGNLDVHSKLALRLTCHTTKGWVDSSTKLLFLFHVVIHSDEIMSAIVDNAKVFPRTKWRNVAFPTKVFTSCPQFPSFVSLFSGHITSLHLHYFNGGLAQILFLSSCECLETLRIDEMDLRENPTLVVASDKMLKSKCPKLLDIFTQLQGLTIGVIYFNDVKQLTFYQTFLQRSRKLRWLNVPRPQGPPKISWEALKGIQLKSLIGPISEYLHKKPITSPIKSDIELLDVDGLFSRHFPTVAEACVRTLSSTGFTNVNEKHVKYLFTHEGDILQRIVSLRKKIDDRRPILRWTRLQTLFVRSSRCDIREEYPGIKAYPLLSHLTLVMDSRSREDPNFDMLRRLVKLLLVERENLQEFILQWPLFGHDTPQDYIRGSDLATNFYNLTKLHLCGWTAPDDDFLLLFTTLVYLQCVVLEECLNLTDCGLLGSVDSSVEWEQPPPITLLRDLTRLEVRNRNNPGFLTDRCFTSALMHMRLRLLVIESFHVTMEAYEWLAKGEFRRTIERLPVPHVLPRGVTQTEFLAFLNANFPNATIIYN